MDLSMLPSAATRLTRRRMLLLSVATGSAGLLAASGLAHAESAAHGQGVADAVAHVLATQTRASAAPRPARLFEQVPETGFAPIASTLTFGSPTDIAAGWDGTLWAIDEAGAPHVYDSESDAWQLFGSGIDAAALVEDAGPAVYFRGAEMLVPDGQHAPRPLGQVWPDLPPSY
jgi:hypothetical protein